MSNLIDKQAAIDASKNADVCVSYTLTEPIDDIVEASIEATKRSVIASIETIEAVQPEPQWIPCSDKAPSEAQECWITAKDGTVCQGMFTRQYGERRDSGFICNGFGFAWLNAVAAWMPYEMPEPYREEGE